MITKVALSQVWNAAGVAPALAMVNGQVGAQATAPIYVGDADELILLCSYALDGGNALQVRVRWQADIAGFPVAGRWCWDTFVQTSPAAGVNTITQFQNMWLLGSAFGNTLNSIILLPVQAHYVSIFVNSTAAVVLASCTIDVLAQRTNPTAP